jgi:hypothetical protein
VHPIGRIRRPEEISDASSSVPSTDITKPQELPHSDSTCPHALCVTHKGNYGRRKVSLQYGVEEGRPRLIHGVESKEVNVLIPYLGPELIAAILNRESAAALDLGTDSKSATKNSLLALRSQSTINDKPVHIPLRRKAFRLRWSRLFTAVRGLVVLWLR